ncbi:hypothetical protein GLAREA_11143 [Glarea lozoyensis ATCC 20868]|uniref:2EXR domain-containing protein n=1 Tax=Glarea lozoyensis (strain ATCC 20868 / MF5171) TaxID=1116229 RepID=S3DEA9_GLAL2|nr:uncharacterized protein GLAREA_11143 [Glarea lozoyensis ATCC 20868]EPE35444.1 hypothetical protein GLAREA_11143 [Glarea lozoyensis ATCC 20868]
MDVTDMLTETIPCPVYISSPSAISSEVLRSLKTDPPSASLFTASGLYRVPGISEVRLASIIQSTTRQILRANSSSHRTPDEAPTTFHGFQNLPPELRLRIWALSLPPPRLVPLTYSPISQSPYKCDWDGCTSTCPIPAILHVNRESRTYATGRNGFALSLNLIYTQPKIWFNHSTDVLYFSEPSRRKYFIGRGLLESFGNFHNATSLIDRKELGRIKRLAIDVDLFKTRWLNNGRRNEEDPLLFQFWEHMRSKFIGLEDITFVLPNQALNATAKLPHSGVFLPVEWLREKELEERAEYFSRRVEKVVSMLGGVLHSSAGPVQWRVPYWRILVPEQSCNTT